MPARGVLRTVVAVVACGAWAADAGAVTGPRFSAPIVAHTGDSPLGFAAADFDGDGKPDLATAEYGSNSVSVLVGRGDGTFLKRLVVPTSRRPIGIVAADVNGDGKPDLVTASAGSDAAVTVLLNDGDGRFHRSHGYAPGGFGVAAADVNGDGLVDLLTARGARKDFAVLLGTGAGNFGAATVLTGARRGAGDVAIGDVNADGKLDAALVTYGNRVVIRLGNGDGTFGVENGYPAGATPLDVNLADLNHDGKLDLATANYEGDDVSVLLGNGDGTFGPRRRYATSGEPDTVVIADFDGDGNADIAATAGDGVPVIRTGRGDGTFNKGKAVPWVFATGATAADFNLDGRPDLVVGQTEGQVAKVFLNWTGLAAPPCVVLDVTALTLRRAERYIHFGGCELGHVRHRSSDRVRKGRVISQTPTETAVLPSASRIDLVISSGRRPESASALPGERGAMGGRRAHRSLTPLGPGVAPRRGSRARADAYRIRVVDRLRVRRTPHGSLPAP